MNDRFNTAAGWVLFSGIVALGLASVSSRIFEADPKMHPAEDAKGGEAGGKAAEPFEALLAKADVAKGEAAFKKCMSCHTIDQGGANGIGPNLYAVVGDKKAEGRGGFAFSDALKAKGGTWDWASLNEWLTNPKAYAPGTKMSFAGLSDSQERANVMAFLNSKGSNLPLPAVPAAAAAAAPAAGAPVAAADPAKGEASFAKCKSCHTIDQGGANGIGPNLFGIAGDKVAEGRGGFAFSDGLKAKGGTWDDASLDAWLTNPRAYAAGTKMSFAGLSDAAERANVIAYLKTKK